MSAGYLAIVEDISHHEGTSIGEIAGRTGLAQSLVSKTVAELREAGVVFTSSDPHDKRRIVVSVAPTTRTGVFEVRAARPVKPALRAIRPRASDADLRRVEALLDELDRHLLG